MPDSGRLIIEGRGVPPPVRVFFSASGEQHVRVGMNSVTSEIRLNLRVVQGRPDVLTLGLSGEGEVVDVSGNGLRDWAVRQGAGETAGRRFLDLRVGPAALDEIIVRTHHATVTVPGTTAVLIVTAGEAVGFSSKIVVQPEVSLDVRVTGANGLTPLEDALQFLTAGEGRLEVSLAPRGGALAEAELGGAQLAGTVNELGRSVEFRLRAVLRAQKAGARLRLLSGGAALDERAAGDGWHVELVREENGFAYDLVADRVGSLPVELTFVAAVREAGDWQALDFRMPAGAVVPLQLEGLGAEVSFKTDARVVPERRENRGGAPMVHWRGFLPADGEAALAWKQTRESAEAALAFTSTEQTEVRIGAGRLRQSTQVAFRVLQGKLAGVRLRVDGPGEILGVEGENIVGWNVRPKDDTSRVLEVQLSRPIEAQGALTVQGQAELGAFPARAEPLRLTPEGGVRHSGHVRVANTGAVRLEITDVSGMMQLAPTQWPGRAAESGTRQVFVYRLPSANYSYHIAAMQVQPEIGISAIATYEVAETARVINASVELDVREAPLRESKILIPENYAVVSLTGSEVADHVVETEAENGYRILRVLFGRAIEGRQLLQLRLEANQPAAAGEWSLPALRFPGAKTVRGHVGAVATPGFRIVPAQAEGLVEIPLNLFPQPVTGLQQAWRLREPMWTAQVRIEALGQSVQADVFHLYTLTPGVVTSSVLLNYFVVGAPASEWRIEVPPTVGNIDVVGQNVRRDWRREGNEIVVSLHQPVLGAATLLVTFEQPMSARGGVIEPGVVRPVGVQAERGFVQVVSALQVRHAIRRAEGALLKLEPAELPAEFRTFTSAPSLAVYHYTERPFGLEMGIEWYAPGETVEQVVDFAQLATQVSRDGQVVTEAQFFVKTRGQKALRLVLPAGAKLWEARVDNALVHARADGEQMLIPLPARANANDPVPVALRIGQANTEGGSRLRLAAPRIANAPTVISEWRLRGDSGRLLVPSGGNAELVRPPLTETGFEWVSTRGWVATLGLLALVAIGAALLRGRSRWRAVAGMGVGVAAVGLAGLLASSALNARRVNLRELTFAATMVPADEAVTVEVENVPGWRAMMVEWGVVAAAAGVGLSLLGARRRGAGRGYASTSTMVGSLVLVAAGLLAQHGGATLFFGAVCVGVCVRVLIPGVMAWQRGRGARLLDPGAGRAGVVSTLIMGVIATWGMGGAVEARAAENARPASELAEFDQRPAERAVQHWWIRGDRVFAELELTVRGVTGDSFHLLRAPGVLTEFAGEGLRVGKVERDGKVVYVVAAERDGTASARVRFELPLGDRAQPIVLPTGPAATQRLTVELDQAGWEIVSPGAVQVTPTAGVPEESSGATLVLVPGATSIQLRPKRRDVSAERAHFFVEGAQLFVPGPGVVNGFSRFTVRPVRGRVTALELEIPAGLTVGEVGRGPVGAWRFDPQTRRLHVAIEPAQAETFRFEVETQLGAGELPFALAIAPLRVRGAAGESGMLALAFGGDAQSEGMRASELALVNAQDFDATLLPRTREGAPLAALQNVWRYTGTGGRVELKIAPVAPEVRVTSRQVLSLDDDRMLLAVDLRVAITRVGIFKLSFALPDGLEVEALSGAALSQWTEAQEARSTGSGQDAARIVTLHLNGRTMGEHTFNLTLAGAAPRAQEAWPFPRLAIREATRQSAEALVVPGKGIRLRAVAREQVTQLDPRAIGGMQAGALAFRLLQDDWVLQLGIETLEAWVTAQALQEVTLREGQTLMRIAVRYRVENAAVKSVRVRLPGLDENAARTVRASGPAVSDIVSIASADTPDLWEIRFRRGIAGETGVQLEFQGVAVRAGHGEETIATPEFVGSRQTRLFVAVRGYGRLDLAVEDLPRGWLRGDWSAVPAVLHSRSDRSVPALCFRVAEPERALVVNVRRHDVAEALKLRGARADLTTLLAPGGAFLTAVELKVDVLEQGTLRMRLPAGARLFNTFVNGESVAAVRDGEAWLFHVAPQAAGDRAAAVRLVYSAAAPANGDLALIGPSLAVPLENVTWRVVLPPGCELADYSGGLRLREERYGGAFGVSEYRSLVSSRRAADAQQAVALLQEANRWMAKGEQEKASEALSRVSNQRGLDDASNEDARVQLRNLKTQQAVLGVNTRRQRLYLDHRSEGARNDPLEEAVNLNPFMHGKQNFDPRQVEQLLMGNTSDENTALRGIAAKIVDQQLGAEPAPSAIDVTLPERGQVVTFTRSLQVDGGAPLELSLEVKKIARSNIFVSALLLLGVGAIAVLGLRGKAPAVAAV